jgi:sugar phosphate permease
VWALVGVSVLFGLPTGLNTVGNQAAMYAQAPPDQIGAAAGLMRTFMYIGAVLSAGLIGITYRQRATDTGLHLLGAIMTGVSVLLLVATACGGSLRTTGAAPGRRGTHARTGTGTACA